MISDFSIFNWWKSIISFCLNSEFNSRLIAFVIIIVYIEMALLNAISISKHDPLKKAFYSFNFNDANDDDDQSRIV